MNTDLLLVIPAFEESQRLPAFLESLAARLAECNFSTAILVVDDGSSVEESREMVTAVDSIRQRHANVLAPLVLPQNAGKGGAIMAGWNSEHTARWLGFVDADGSISPDEVARVMGLALATRRTAFFASRIRMLGRVVARRFVRHAIGRVYATMVGRLIHPGVYDSQCGFKIIPASAFAVIRGLLTEQRFAFDVQLLAALLHCGFPIEEVAIDWRDTAGSKVRFFRDTLQMAESLRRIRRARAQWPAAQPIVQERAFQDAPLGVEVAGI